MRQKNLDRPLFRCTGFPRVQEHNPTVNVYNTHTWSRAAQLKHNAVSGSATGSFDWYLRKGGDASSCLSLSGTADKRLGINRRTSAEMGSYIYLKTR